eukprot:scaffold35293_cov260-Amphora_coffeaeformis.AAC.4
MRLSLGVLVGCLLLSTARAWISPPAAILGRVSVSVSVPVSMSKLSPPSSSTNAVTSTTALQAGGGFGGGGGSKKKSSSSEAKLKPKAQWDRFLEMKKGATRIRVAVKTTSNDNDSNDEEGEWLEVGHVKSAEDKYTALAVARQRALIAEHAKRLFPLQVSPKDTIAWAYWNEQDESWTTVDKKILQDEANIPDGLEKLIGFEGRPDPSSGYYCVYNEGRLANDSADARPSSKKLK